MFYIFGKHPIFIYSVLAAKGQSSIMNACKASPLSHLVHKTGFVNFPMHTTVGEDEARLFNIRADYDK